MSRFDDFTDFKDNQIDDIVLILQHRGVTVDVYRPEYENAEGSLGFSQELGNLVRVERILAVIVPVVDMSSVGVSDVKEAMSSYYGITNWLGTRLGDEWRSPDGAKYRVKAFAKEFDYIVQVYLERIYD